MTTLSRVVVSPLDDADTESTTLHPTACAGSSRVSERACVKNVSLSLKVFAPKVRCNPCRRKTADEAMNFDPQSGRLGQRELVANPASYRVVGTEGCALPRARRSNRCVPLRVLVDSYRGRGRNTARLTGCTPIESFRHVPDDGGG